MKFLSAILLSALLLNCSSVPLNTGFHSNFTEFKKGKNLDMIWVGSSRPGNDISPAFLKEIGTNKITDHPTITKEYCMNILKSSLLRRTSMFTEDKSVSKSDLLIAITEMTPGNAATRIWIGELGAGHAWIQIEGKIKVNDELVFAFAERRRHSGAAGLADIAGDAGKSMVTEMIHLIAEDIYRELVSYLSGT